MVDPTDLRARVVEARERLGLSQNALASRMGFSASVLSQWLKGSYGGDVAGVEAKVRNWLDGLDNASVRAVQAMADPGFVETPTARRMLGLLERAHHGPDIVVIAGAPGVSKSSVAEHYAQRRGSVWIATMDPSLRSPNDLLREACHVCGVDERSPTQLRYAFAERVRATRGLLIIDECQHLTKPALDMARSFHDRHGIGVCLMGNHGFFAGTAASSRTDGFAQFFSRIGARMLVSGASAEDVDALLDAWRIEERESRVFLHRVAGKMGALRSVRKTLNNAVAIAADDGNALGIGHLKAAWTTLNHFEGAA